MNFFEKARLPATYIGLIFIFMAERYEFSDFVTKFFLGGGFILLLLGLFAAFSLSRSAQKEGFSAEAKSWMIGFYGQLVLFLSVLSYYFYQFKMDFQTVPVDFVQKFALALWLLLLVIGLFVSIGTEFSLAKTGRGEFAEPVRVKKAALSWLSVGLLLSFLVSINYTVSKKDYVMDWSYLKVTKPSASTLKMVSTITEPIEIAVFYPKNNDILPYLQEYFNAVKKGSKLLKLSYFDKDLHPKASKDFRAGRNGLVVLKKGEEREKINVGLKMRGARKVLSKLDARFQKVFAELTSDKRTAYFTSGHGELSWLTPSKNPLTKISMLESWLRGQNYNVRSYGVADGLGKDIPDDASIVFILGPVSSFMPEEIASLIRYINKGGKVFIALDVEQSLTNSTIADTERPLVDFLAKIGIDFHSEVLADTKNFLRSTRSRADHSFLFTNKFTSHPSVSLLTNNDEKVAVFAIRSGYYTIDRKRAVDWNVFDTIRSLHSNFIDLNKDFSFDPANEKRKTYILGVGASKKVADKEARILAFSDANVFSNAVFRNPGNLLYLAGSLKWLAGENKIIGIPASEEDTKIKHYQKDDVILFYGSVSFMPLFLLFLGFLANRKKRVLGGSDANE